MISTKPNHLNNVMLRKAGLRIILICTVFFILASCSKLSNLIDKTLIDEEDEQNDNIPTISKTMYPQFEEQAERLLAKMTVEEKVGQMFIVRHPRIDAMTALETFQFGGFIFFARDFQDKSIEEVNEMTSTYQNKSSIPLFLAVDEEGGTVTRISKFKQFRAVPFYSPRALYNEGGWELVKSDTIEKANLLITLGLNLNLAPVADLSFDSKDYMYPRTFGQSVDNTAYYIDLMIKTMNDNQIGSTLKHFPGYGNNADTHTGIAYDNRSYQNFIDNDFIPFVSGIKAGAPSILVSHNIVSSMDSTVPASLSVKIHEILRDELGFKGVIMTDDLYMNAIKTYVDIEQAAVMAVKAGNDLIISTNYAEQIHSVIEAIRNEEINVEQIDDSVLRILCWKIALKMIH